MENIHVPYGCTVHGEEEIAAVTHVLRTSTQMGKHVRKMEERVAALFDKKHGIMVNSGSSALYLAVEILNLPKGSEVITPALTFSTTVAPQIKNGLIPVLVDVEPGTFCIDADKIEELITDKTSALIIPNLIGNVPDWKKLSALAKKYNLKVIEDSADTLGATINGESSGKHSDISITSFYGSHVINCAGNGGMLCVNSDEHNDRARLLRSWGRSSSLFVESEKIENRFDVQVDGIEYDSKFVFEALGYNLEPSEMGAAFGLVQLDKLDFNISEREKNYDFMINFFKEYEDWFILPNQFPNSKTGWLAFAITIKDSAPFSRREFQIFMEKRNIQTRTVFSGNIARQPLFKNVEYRISENGAPNTDLVMRGGMLMACHHGLTDVQREYLVANAKVFLDGFK
jgi:CDP-6-deoxy-D-xylo-4-hexulose-3-dehydrase|tara:strand:+ start:178 stop:1377 length:1200 start_codon:yes stop_codon:yes gene_type:complete